MRIIETKVFTIDEHPDKEKCFDWIRENWHDLNQHSLDELIDSLKALAKEVGGKLDYAVSCVPDRGEFIRIKDYDKDRLTGIDKAECPLTGVCWDYDVIKALKNGDFKPVLDILHNETEFQYSSEALEELCDSMEYEFNEEGAFV